MFEHYNNRKLKTNRVVQFVSNGGDVPLGRKALEVCLAIILDSTLPSHNILLLAFQRNGSTGTFVSRG